MPQLGTLSDEQLAAVEALTRGNRQQVPAPAHAGTQAGGPRRRSARLDALCDEWSVSLAGPVEAERRATESTPQSGEENKVVSIRVREGGAEVRR
jgi:hypothetical protein